MESNGRIVLARPLREWERELLREGDLYLVGGTVRDLLRGKSYESIDEDYLAVGIALERLVSVLDRFGSTNLVGRSFGVVKFVATGLGTVDFSLPRKEYSVGPGHRDFNVDYDPSIPVEEDLVRRDFTINSMALHLGSGAIVDPLGGRSDLAGGILRVNREGSFREDPLRILRGVQFFARFSLSVEAGTREMMIRDRELLATVSGERVRDELNKMLLKAERPSAGFRFMHETGILALVLPELDETYGIEQNEYHPDDIFTHSIKSCDAAPPDLAVRWGALLHDLGKKKMKQEVDGRVVFYRHQEESEEIAERILTRLKFPGDFTKRVALLVRHHMFHMTDEWSDGAVRRFISRVGRENLDAFFALCEADARSRESEEMLAHVDGARRRVEAILAAEPAFKREDLAVNGSDIMERFGIDQGPEVGEILDALLELVIDRPEMNTRDRLLDAVREMRSGER